MANGYTEKNEEEYGRYLKEIRAREIAEMQYIENQKQLALADMERQGVNTNQPYKMGVGAYTLILFALFVDILEMITTITVVGAIISVPLGLLVDTAIFIGVGLSKNARKQWKRFATGFVAENFPVLSSALEFIPFRTISLIWMYRGMSQPGQKESEENKEGEKTNEQ